MIVPVLTQLRPDHTDDLVFFFRVCDWPFDPEQPFNPNNTILALHKGQIVGFVTAWIDNQPYAYVDVLIVHPDFRGQGIGYYLAHAIREIVLRRGANAIRFNVTNPELVATLERCSCTRVDATVMEWKRK